MQKIILFFEPYEKAFMTSAKLGNIFMNRSAIDENDSSEIVNVLEFSESLLNRLLDTIHYEKQYDRLRWLTLLVKERQRKGMDHSLVIIDDKLKNFLRMIHWRNG